MPHSENLPRLSSRTLGAAGAFLLLSLSLGCGSHEVKTPSFDEAVPQGKPQARPSLTAKALADPVLVPTLNESEIFKGGVLPADPQADQSADIMISFKEEVLQYPSMEYTWFEWVGIFPPFYFLLFFCPERDPPMKIRFEMKCIALPDETLGQYATTGTAVIAAGLDANASAYQSEATERMRPTALRILTHKMAADEGFCRKVREMNPDAEDQNVPAIKDLMVSKESSVFRGRWRNRALLRVKNLSLPQMLRDGKTGDLTALFTKLEQLILDMNHEAELAKDQAQKEVEKGTGMTTGFRGLSLVYLERIEILKPMVAAIKEEIANRGK